MVSDRIGIDYYGDVMLRLTPKNRKVYQLLRWIDTFNMLCEYPEDIEDFALGLVQIFIDPEKRKNRLLKQTMKCPNCKIYLIPEVRGKQIGYRCDKCKYIYSKYFDFF